jgi:hypothetical protein
MTNRETRDPMARTNIPTTTGNEDTFVELPMTERTYTINIVKETATDHPMSFR